MEGPVASSSALAVGHLFLCSKTRPAPSPFHFHAARWCVPRHLSTLDPDAPPVPTDPTRLSFQFLYLMQPQLVLPQKIRWVSLLERRTPPCRAVYPHPNPAHCP
ncbi:hypothetical protein I4F81_007314 [Pyropia yezoensis]|uniref:Uncharacterized protein n=1 Tax=Pyropia yezoensis TaxID=2788 RepID=A0ACC3C4T3_PYRYE|nr:hypothetical protein I4F81_007314 [Neopyropia yezoensis]